MKARIRKTGEIVDVVYHNHCSTIRSSQDFVSYVDSMGVEHDRESLNFYWDFERIEKDENDAHWQDVRERAAIAAMEKTIDMITHDYKSYRDIVVEGYSGSKRTCPNIIAHFAIACADALVEQLKK